MVENKRLWWFSCGLIAASALPALFVSISVWKPWQEKIWCLVWVLIGANTTPRSAVWSVACGVLAGMLSSWLAMDLVVIFLCIGAGGLLRLALLFTRELRHGTTLHDAVRMIWKKPVAATEPGRSGGRRGCHWLKWVS
jgi:hypothetical protein